MSDVVQAILIGDQERAKEVVRRLESIRDITKSNFFELCDLLLEAHENSYHLIWGYGSFKDWIEACNLDIKWRAAYNYLAVAQRSRELGVGRDELAKLPITTLTEIFSLKPADHAEDMRQLIGEAEDLTTDEVKQRVKQKKLKAGEEMYTHLNLKIPVTVKEIVDEAFELARRLHGSVVDEFGNVVDISDGKCLEYIAASFLADPNHQADGESLNTEVPEDEVVIIG